MSVTSPDTSSSEGDSSEERHVLPSCPSTCSVCGDAATGHFYGVVACSGCKNFFWRSVLGERTYVCKKDGRCMEDEEQAARHKCRKCRFERCVDVGMNPLGIRTTADLSKNKVVREVVSRQRALAAQVTQPSTSVQMLSVEETIERLIDGLMRLETACDKLRKSQLRPDPKDLSLNIDQLIASPYKIGFDYGDMPGWPLPQRPPPKNYIPIEKYATCGELPVPKPKTNCAVPANMKHWRLMNIVSVIEYVKTFDVFHRLTHVDKVVLLKHVTLLGVHLMNGFFSYAQKSDVTVNPDGTTTLFGAGDERSKYFYAIHRSVIATLIRISPARQEYVLLKAIVVCCDGLSGLSAEGRALLGAARARYANALLSFSLATRGISKGAEMYTSLLGIVDQLERVTRMDKVIRVYSTHFTDDLLHYSSF